MKILWSFQIIGIYCFQDLVKIRQRMSEASKESSGIEKSFQAMSGGLDEILRQISDLVTSTQDLRSSEADRRRKMAAVVLKMERKEGVWDAEKAK